MAMASSSSTMRGSSPLTRGKRHSLVRLGGGSRLIPAHAGKTSCERSPRSQPRAHPRSRGENLKCGCLGVAVLGSSPLTRGKLDQRRPAAGLGGLIPAHAGKTRPALPSRGSWPAHPRSRGENIRACGLGLTYGGSSPLTRGKPGGGRHFDLDAGLIPAHAGKTSKPP